MQTREVDVEQFTTGRRSNVAVDVRSAEEFAAGACAGQELYVICQSGGRSAKAAEALDRCRGASGVGGRRDRRLDQLRAPGGHRRPMSAPSTRPNGRHEGDLS